MLVQSLRPQKLGNSLCKNTSYDVYIIKLLHSSLFYPTLKSYALQPDTPKSASSRDTPI